MTPKSDIRPRLSGPPFFMVAAEPSLIDGGKFEYGDQLLVYPDDPVTDGATVLVDTAAGRFVATVCYVDDVLHLKPISPDLSPMVVNNASTIRLYRIRSVHKSV
ncbi:MAG: hypothetical protein ABL970_00915 [Nitrospira sp.]